MHDAVEIPSLSGWLRNPVKIHPTTPACRRLTQLDNDIEVDGPLGVYFGGLKVEWAASRTDGPPPCTRAAISATGECIQALACLSRADDHGERTLGGSMESVIALSIAVCSSSKQ
eukprot:2196819-Amphidinium_carterae.2